MDLDDLFKHLGGPGKHARHRHGGSGHDGHRRHEHDRHHDDHDHDDHDRLLEYELHRRDDGSGGDREARRHGHLERRDEWLARGHGPFGSRRALLALLARYRWLVAAVLAAGLVLLALATWLLVTIIEAVAPAATAGMLGQLRSIVATVLEAVRPR